MHFTWAAVLTVVCTTLMLQTHGLLEVKCPSVSSITECKYLVEDGATDNLHLETTHEYYYQVQGQMGLTGASWCDFYVQALEDFHCERITADRKFQKYKGEI